LGLPLLINNQNGDVARRTRKFTVSLIAWDSGVRHPNFCFIGTQGSFHNHVKTGATARIGDLAFRNGIVRFMNVGDGLLSIGL
jgi:hypothetical protein